jgi:class 3 adenylate cyclase
LAQSVTVGCSLEAIAALHGDTGSTAPSADMSITSSVPNVAPEDRAERRQVTVMFSDLVALHNDYDSLEVAG